MDNINEQVITDTNTQTATPIVQDVPINESAEQKYQRLYGGQQAQTVQPTTADLQATLLNLQSELSALRQSQTVVATNTQTATPSGVEWVEKVRSGDFTGATEALERSISAKITPQIEAARQKAYEEATAAAQVQLEMDRFLGSVRQTNPDLIQFEKYLQGPVNERMALAQQVGRLRTPQDFLREYKAAVNDEVTNLRNMGLQFRAAGKDDAQSRIVDVNRSTPLNPQQVQSNQVSQQASPQNPQGESTEDYFARRRADESKRRGLG